jgi:hypothetical protein
MQVMLILLKALERLKKDTSRVVGQWALGAGRVWMLQHFELE